MSLDRRLRRIGNKNNDRYQPKTQFELIELFNTKDTIEEQFKLVQKEEEELRKKYLSEVQEKYNKLLVYLDHINDVSYIYSGKPIRNEWEDGVHCIAEIMGEHQRRAVWYNQLMFDDFDLWESGIFYEAQEKQKHFNDHDEFVKYANDWVVNGILP